jgi:hypothetical protein
MNNVEYVCEDQCGWNEKKKVDGVKWMDYECINEY